MKKIIVFISMIFLLSFISVNKTNYIHAEIPEVEHIFTHCLIAYPEIAFRNDNPMKNNYLTDCITKDEFKLILKSLYKNNYILVNANDTFCKNKNGQTVKKNINVPKNKKPLIFSFDDVNYDSKKMHLGMVDKIIIDENGELASSTFIGGKSKISYSNEFIPILENFIKLHPDFSYKNAKGMINLTGYDGILGYRTQSSSPNRENEIKECRKVVNKLKKNGWYFACHSYGHYHMKKISLAKFEHELDKWNNEVKPLIGETSIYVYPYGEWEIEDKNDISAKHKLLESNGFQLFCGVGMKYFYNYLPKTNILFMDRKNIDGYSLQKRHSSLLTLFDPDLIYDSKKRDN